MPYFAIEPNQPQHTRPTHQSIWAALGGIMNLTRHTNTESRSIPLSGGDSSSGTSSTLSSPNQPQRQGTGFTTHRVDSFETASLEAYVSTSKVKSFDVSILSSDGKYAALVSKRELATFRDKGDDDCKFEKVALYPLVQRYKAAIASASRTKFAVVASNNFDIYAFVGENGESNPIISQECNDIVAIALAADDQWVCVGTAQGEIRRWRIIKSSEPEPSRKFKYILNDNNPQPLWLRMQPCAISFSSDNSQIFVGSWNPSTNIQSPSAKVTAFYTESGQKPMNSEWEIKSLITKASLV
ncbi:hypothetical protein BDD12DRAFT_131389 [Trichophaea hybrida]|nr:hypothetical protein BDD12DRAFT_131389 [Trichophaea hybrida]